MRACLVVIHRRWSVSVATSMVPLICLVIMLIVLSAWSPVVVHEPEGFVVPHGHAPRFSGPVGGEANIAEILATCEQTAGVWGVWRYTARPQDGPPLHIHRAEDEFFYILRGEFALQLGDCITIAPAGSFVYIPKNTIHTHQNVGTEPGELFGVVTLGGFEQFFVAFPGADADTVNALSTQHAMHVVGPPLDVATSPARLAALRRGAAAVQPAALPSAQTYRIGMLAPGCHPPAVALDILRQGLHNRGYVEGQNLVIAWRYSEGKAERFPELAAELVRQSEVLTITHRCQVLDFAAEQRLPTMAEFGMFAQDGGLMAYGPKLTETFQRGAYYVDKILQGTKPAHLPIEQPMHFELIINPKTAQTLALRLPPTLLIQYELHAIQRGALQSLP